MARGWHGNSAGHAKAGQLGGRKSAENRRRHSQFGEQLVVPARSDKTATKSRTRQTSG